MLVKKLILLLMISVSTIVMYAQNDLLPAFPHEITYKGGRAYFDGQLFSGLLVEKNTNRELGVFRNGHRHGVFSEYYPNGNPIRRTQYSMGVKNGSEQEWHENGIIKKHTDFRDGILHGRLIEWHPSGKQKSDFAYFNGKIQDDIYNICDESGELTERLTYKNATIVSLYTKKTGTLQHFYDNGKIKLATKLNEDGNLNDAYTEWWPNGIVKETGYFVNGLKHGQINSWNINQQKIAQENFRLGKRDSISTYWLADGIIETHDYKDDQLTHKSSINPANQLKNLIRKANEHLMMYVDADGKPTFVLLKFDTKNTKDTYIKELANDLFGTSQKRLKVVADPQQYSDEYISFVVVLNNINYTTTSKYSKESNGTMYTGHISYRIAKFDNLNKLLAQESYDSQNSKTFFVTSYGNKETAIKQAINKADCETYLYQFFPVDGKIIQLTKIKGAKVKEVNINACAINGVKSRMKFTVYNGEPGPMTVVGEIEVHKINSEHSICIVKAGEERILSEFNKQKSLSIRSKF